jgi:hypothetical protein
MVQRDRDLNQTLEEFLLFSGCGAPHVFPDFVGIEEFSCVEQGSAVLEANFVHDRLSREDSPLRLEPMYRSG